MKRIILCIIGFSVLNLITCELGCQDLQKLDSFKSAVQFSANGKLTYIEETKQDGYGKLLIKHKDLLKIYYREKTQTKKFIKFETSKNKCIPRSYENQLFFPDIGEYMFVYDQDKKTFVGPSAIYQKIISTEQKWNEPTKEKKREIDCLVCETKTEDILDLTDVKVIISSKERDGRLEPIRIEVIGKTQGKNATYVTYIIDYFRFESFSTPDMERKRKTDLGKKEFVLDLPSIGCADANFLGTSKFSLYLPEILKLQIRKPKTGSDDSETEELMDIVYDNKNQKIRVDNFLENYYEIAELAKKNFFYFKNNEQCIPFHKQMSYSKNLQTAIEFATDIYKLGKTDFYHIGEQVLDSKVIADVFEFSTTENDVNKDVITLYTTKMKSIEEEDDGAEKLPKLILLKKIVRAYRKNNKEGSFELQHETIYNVADYTEMFYDENYRLTFNLLPCTQNFRDRIYIAFEADFDKETNPDKEQLSLERIVKEEENVKTQLTKLILGSHSISILEIQYVQYYVDNQKLRIQLHLLNTGAYSDSFVEYEDAVYVKNQFAGTLNECAFRSYDQQSVYYGFRYCAFKNKVQLGNCYLVDDENMFGKIKNNPVLFDEHAAPLNAANHRLYEILTKASNMKNISALEKQIMEKPDDNEPDDKEKPVCVLMKKPSEQFKPPIISYLGVLKEDVKAGKFKLTFKKDKTPPKEPPKHKIDLKTKLTDDNPDKKDEYWYLNFNTIDYYPNEELFPVDKQSIRIDLVGTGEAIKAEYLFDEPNSSKQTSINSVNDCYLHCLDLNTDQIVCHSFTFCIGDSKTVNAKCQYSNLYFDKSLEKFENLKKERKFTKKDDKDKKDDSGKETYSKWIEKSEGCNVYNLEYKNYFIVEDDRTIEETVKTTDDLTLEECFSDCYRTTKNVQKDSSGLDDDLCRSIEYCVNEEKINESDLKKTSLCKISNLESKYLPKKDLKNEVKRNCKVYDWKYLNDFTHVEMYSFKKASKIKRFITKELCAKKCSVEPYCQGFEFCHLNSNNDEIDVENLRGKCVYESDESDYVKPTNENNDFKCIYQQKIDGPKIHKEIVLPENSTAENFREMKIIVRDENEVLSSTFFTLNISLFVSSMILVFLLILSYKKFYNRYKNDPHQLYTSFFGGGKKYGC